MSLRDFNIKKEYRSSTSNIVNEFYLPALSNATLYRRAVGFFSSTALVELSRGIFGLIENAGRIELIVSPRLSEEDIEAINQGYLSREKQEVLESILMKSFMTSERKFDKERLNLIYNLISMKRLDIKIAVYKVNSNYGLYHEKMGLIYDNESNIIAFTGSMNESITAFSHNYETIDIFTSWTLENDRVKIKEEAFLSIWNNKENNLETYDFTNAVEKILKPYNYNSEIYNIDKLEYPAEIIFDPNKEIYKKENNRPQIPDSVKLYDYQLEAIKKWKENNFRGIFDMATGTGKTFTGLGAAINLYEFLDGNLAIFIVCPFQHLVEQWVEDIELFGIKPIIGYSASKQKKWKKRLEDGVLSYNLGVKSYFCFVTTNATFSKKFVQNQIEKIKGNCLIIADEAHNLGAEKLSVSLNKKFNYRLALSATIERHGDPEGTQRLYDYFGEKCIKYTLKEAIQNNKLTPYFYYPILVVLNADELSEYNEISKKIKKMYHVQNEKNKISDSAKILMIKRARIIASANEKITKLLEIISEYKKDKNMLIYCGATTIRDIGYFSKEVIEMEMKQVDTVRMLLHKKLKMRVAKFTSEESSDERKKLKSAFSEGTHIQALVAIRCLDEGVNIPSVKIAFILASSTNPKEYIQRRGRVLRKFKGKNNAIIYDFVTIPVALEDVENLSEEELRMYQSLVKNEIARVLDFSLIAENPSNSDSLINNLKKYYRLNKIE